MEEAEPRAAASKSDLEFVATMRRRLEDPQCYRVAFCRGLRPDLSCTNEGGTEKHG